MSATTLGPVDIEFLLKGLNFQAEAEKMKSQLRGISTAAQTEADRIDKAFRRAFAGMAAYFTLYAAESFVSDLVRVRGEFQQLDIAFTTMLGSKEKSDRLMAQTVQLAANTPYSLLQIAQVEKGLIAFGEDSENVADTVTRLGNIASGTGANISELGQAYGKVMSKGKMQAEELNQFTERGVPIVAELAKMYGITAAEVYKLVEQGKVGFPELQQVIKNVTSEGGMFYNLMEKQSATLTGKISNLGDAIDNMYNSMAAGNDSLIGDGIDGLADLVRNYETVLKILESMVVAYGAYKTAVIVNSLTMKGLTIAENLHLIALMAKEKAMKIATASMAMFNKTAMANPLGLILGSLVAVTGALLIFKDRLGGVAQVGDTFNAELAKERANLDLVFGVLKKTKEGTESRSEALKAANSILGSYNVGLLSEKSSVNDIAEAYKLANAAIMNNIGLKNKQLELDAAMTTATENTKDAYDSFYSHLTAKGKGGAIANAISAEARAVADSSEELVKQISYSSRTVGAGMNAHVVTTEEIPIALTKRINAFAAKYKLSAVEAKEYIVDYERSMIQLRSQQSKIESFYAGFGLTAPKAQDGGNGGGAKPAKTPETLGEIEAEITRLTAAQKSAKVRSEFDKLKAEIDKWQAAKEKITGKEGEKAAEKDAKDKAKEELEALKNEIAEKKDLYGEDLYAYQQYLKKKIEEVRPTGDKAQISAVNKEDIETGRAIDKNFKEMLSEYQTYEQKRLAIQSKYANIWLQLTLKGYNREAEEAKKRGEKEVDDLDEANGKKVDSYKWVFAELERMGIVALRKHIARLREELKNDKLSAEMRVEIDKKLQAAEEKMKDAIPDAIRETAGVLGEASRLAKEFDSNLAKSIQTASDLASSVSDIIKGYASGNYVQMAAGIVNTYLTLEKMAEGPSWTEKQAVKTAIVTAAISDMNDALERQVRLTELLNGLQKSSGYADAIAKTAEAYAKTSDLITKEIAALNKELSHTLKNTDYHSGLFTFDIEFKHPEKLKELYAITQKAAADLTATDWEMLISSTQGDEKKRLEELYNQWIAIKEKQKEYFNTWAEGLTGTSYDTLVGNIMEAFSSVDNRGQALADNLQDMFQIALKKGFETEIVAKQLEAFYKNFAASMSDGTLTEEEKAKLTEEYNAAVALMNDKYKEMETMFPDIFAAKDTSTATGLSGAIRGASQESIDLLAGQTGAVRITIAEQLKVMNNSLMTLNKIELNTRPLEPIYNILAKMATNNSRGYDEGFRDNRINGR